MKMNEDEKERANLAILIRCAVKGLRSSQTKEIAKHLNRRYEGVKNKKYIEEYSYELEDVT